MWGGEVADVWGRNRQRWFSVNKGKKQTKVLSGWKRAHAGGVGVWREAGKLDTFAVDLN